MDDPKKLSNTFLWIYLSFLCDFWWYWCTTHDFTEFYPIWMLSPICECFLWAKKKTIGKGKYKYHCDKQPLFERKNSTGALGLSVLEKRLRTQKNKHNKSC